MRGAAHRSRSGFTLLEIMVAVAVSTVLFGICVAVFMEVSRYKSRSEDLLLYEETARGVFDRLGRDLAGLYIYSNDGGAPELADYWRLADNSPNGERLTFLAATENPGGLDYCTVSYYAANGALRRLLSSDMGGSAPSGGWPTAADSALADAVTEMLVSTTPAVPADGTLPRLVTVTIKLTDPKSELGYRRYTATFRPGSEEH